MPHVAGKPGWPETLWITLTNLRLMAVNDENDEVLEEYNSLELNSTYFIIPYYYYYSFLLSFLFIIIIILSYYYNSLLIYRIIIAITSRIRRLAVMVKYTTDVKKLFQEGIIRAKEEGILLETFRKRVIPIDKVYPYLFIYYNTIR